MNTNLIYCRYCPIHLTQMTYSTKQQWKKHAPHVNVSVLVYTSTKRYEDHIRDLKFEGNFRSQCNLDFDCFFYQNHKHQITPDFFYSMDAVMLGMQAVHVLRQLFPYFHIRISKTLCIIKSFKVFSCKFSEDYYQSKSYLKVNCNKIKQGKKSAIHFVINTILIVVTV